MDVHTTHNVTTRVCINKLNLNTTGIVVGTSTTETTTTSTSTTSTSETTSTNKIFFSFLCEK
jgi:hypothetical protein